MDRFSDEAAGWDEKPGHADRARSVAAVVRSAVPLRPGMSVLEIGGGTGLLARALAEDIGTAVVTDVAPGDFVVLNWRAVCGQCRACKRGRPHLCFDTHNAAQKMTLTDGTELTPALGIGAFLTLSYMVIQADPRENKFIQALPIACVSALVTAGLLVVFFLDRPYAGNHGGIAPVEMSRTLARIDAGVQAPCDERGDPR